MNPNDIFPNIHPALVHFPIAFFILALAVDFFAVILRKFSWLAPAAVLLYAAAALGALAAMLSGESASESVNIAAPAQSTLSAHEEWGERTMWGMLIYAVLRIILFKKLENRAVQFGFWAVSLVGAFALYQTAGLGGKLVYRYGTGVTIGKNSEHRAMSMNSDSAVASAEGFKNLFKNGSLEKLHVTPMVDEGGTAYSVHVPEPTKLLSRKVFKNSEVRVQADASGFNGAFTLLHNFKDEQNYGFMEINNGSVALGRIENGRRTVYSKSVLKTEGWTDVKLVSVDEHYRGYTGGKMVVHGHGKRQPDGASGIFLNGTGTVKLREFHVENI